MEPPDDLSDSEYTPAPSTSTSAPASVAPPAQQLKQSTLPFSSIPSSVYLADLNPAQLEAVTASPSAGLAVHAGPGSGKTKVLTTRVAWLIQEAKIKPEELVVVTFTNKAANEMRVRLAKLVGPAVVDKVVMGTFHSVCFRYLRKYGKLVGLQPNFLITDRDDCLAIIKRLLQQPFVPVNLKREMKPPLWLEIISRCKAKMLGPEGYRIERMTANGAGTSLSQQEEEKVEAVARMYEAYESELAKANAVDFDDLLLRGHELFSSHPRVVGKIQSVLIDEFQDTNTVQYDLVKLIARASGSLTIVGDPDQSIYGWRSAEVENLDKMLQDFKPVRQIFLEQNYRSTGAILGAALAVVRQDTKRINKSLQASHPSGSSVVLHHAPSAQDEATFIASSIKHLVAHLGGLVSYNDCAVLLRYGALSRAVESAFQRMGVPSRMVGGHKFFERAEIKDLLSYLQLIHNPSYTPALLRVLNTPRRGLGDKTIKDLTSAAEKKGLSTFEVCVRLVNGQVNGLGMGKGLGPAQKKALGGLVKVVRDVRKLADEGSSVADLLDFVCDKVGYQTYLEKTHSQDWQERWENVKELKSYATIVAEENPTTADLLTALDPDGEGGEPGESQFEEVSIPPGGGGKEDESDDEIEIIEPDAEDGEEDDEDVKIEVPLSSQAADEGRTTPLEVFLATSMLATDTDTQDAKSDAQADKVTLSTCHAAKGLEWPIVFVPACENGTYPFFRAEKESEVDEERRLLYVAITRAQGFCFLSYANSRMAGAETKQKELSPFLSTVSTTYSPLFVPKLQKVTKQSREEMAKVLGRPVPDEEEAKKRIEEYNATQPVEPVIYDPLLHGASVTTSRNYGFFGGRYGGGGGGFTSLDGAGAGRYSGGAGVFSTAGGQSLGRWSDVSSASQPQPQAVPPGAGGFRSALSDYNSGGSLAAPSSSAPPRLTASNPYAAAAAQAAAKPNPWRAGTRKLAAPGPSSATTLPPPPRASGRSSAFRPPAMMNPVVPGPPTSSTSHPTLPTLSSSSASAPEGKPDIVETRASIISDAVLVNPKLSQPGPSKSGDLLASFEKGAKGELDAFRLFGGGKGGRKEEVEEIVIGSSSPARPPADEGDGDLSGVKLSPQSPKRSARGGKKRAAPAAMSPSTGKKARGGAEGAKKKAKKG
ncbi:hypothetical protein JCM8547_008911 [Rhodosporidiobolus lusitaniae]